MTISIFTGLKKVSKVRHLTMTAGFKSMQWLRREENVTEEHVILVTIGVLLECVNPRFIFCCQEFRDGVYETSMGARVNSL